MDETLLEEVTARLDADAEIDEDVRLLIDAALLDELDAVIEGGEARRPEPAGVVETPRERLFVASLDVAGFRGVGPKARLVLSPGPGLTLVVGRNGSGKSSFAEGLELLLTGDNRRWSQRKSKEWQRGFRNVHTHGAVELRAEVLIEGSPKAEARRFWNDGEELEGGAFSLRVQGKSYSSVAELGWEAPLRAYRPFLSYNEIGSILDEGPSALFDTLNPILGLADLGEAADRLKARLKELKDDEKDVKARLRELLDELKALDDERAPQVAAALSGRKWKLDEAEEILNCGALAADGSTSGRLVAFAQLGGPNLEAVGAAAAGLGTALERLHATRASDADRARRLLGLLAEALELHDAAGDGDCPVCGQEGALDAAWHARTARKVSSLRREAEGSEKAHRAVAEAALRARGLVAGPPPFLAEAAELGLDAGAVRGAWEDWAALGEADAATLRTRLEERAVGLASEVEKLRQAAEARRQALERNWSAVALDLHAWLVKARRVAERSEVVKRLAKAEKRLSEEIQEIRNDRFAPIKDEVFKYWELLRARSSVDVANLALAGKRTSRKVEIDVAVDGAPAAALGVMSQGELHALALSLFLPRATLKESPFGFLFIDDPVQAMDLARVDGLARVLEQVARRHQVVVFTHDDRLPAAVRRLQVPARILTVERGKESVVEVRPALDPVKQHLDDAFALAQTRGLPDDVAVRVVPGLCRQAVEAACTEVVRRRRLAAGEPHAAVAQLLLENSKLNSLLALAMTDDPHQVPAAKEKLRKRIDPRAREIVDRCNRGAHHGWDGDLVEMVRDTERVALKLLELD